MTTEPIRSSDFSRSQTAEPVTTNSYPFDPTVPPPGLKPRPRNIEISITGRCNLKCQYCFYADEMAALSDLQRGLVARAAQYVRQGGKLVYATCSIEPEENERVIQRSLTGASGWRLLRSKLSLPRPGKDPDDWRDGGFHAVMLRE